MSKEKEQCMTEGCPKPAEMRGVCSACMAAMRRYVKKGKTTWQELESLGLVKPRHQSLFDIAFEKAKAADNG